MSTDVPQRKAESTLMGYTAATIAEASAMMVICLLSILGNGSLFIIVHNTSRLHTVSNYFILSLAAADLLVTGVSGSVTASVILRGDWMFTEEACIAFGFITMTAFIASVANLIMIALNRYFYIVRWKKYKIYFTKMKSAIYVAIVWLLSLSLSTPPLLGWSEYKFLPDKSLCFVNWPSNVYYMYFMIAVCFFGPLVTMATCYYTILRFTRSLKQRISSQAVRSQGFSPMHQQVSEEEAKLTNTLLLVVACFVVCWAPCVITMFLDVYYPYRLPRAVNIGSVILGYFNSMCNPIVYGVRNSNFRNGFRNLYGKMFPCIFRRVHDSVDSESGSGLGATIRRTGGNSDTR